jgi:pseudouridine-5'-phosphate glycosidase
MPTLDDTPILEQLATVELDASNAGAADKIATQDLVLVYDMSQRKIKAITVSAFMSAITDVSVSATTGTD